MENSDPVSIISLHPIPTFHFDVDPDPVFHFDADPDPASQNDGKFSKKTWISGWLRWRRF
jgi:hypothetical protein